MVRVVTEVVQLGSAKNVNVDPLSVTTVLAVTLRAVPAASCAWRVVCAEQALRPTVCGAVTKTTFDGAAAEATNVSFCRAAVSPAELPLTGYVPALALLK